jgi:hypothetical protein
MVYLYARLLKVDFLSHLFASEDVGVSCLGEHRLEAVELCASERCPLAALLSDVSCDEHVTVYFLETELRSTESAPREFANTSNRE